MGLFGNKREKGEKVDKYEYHSSTKAARNAAYGPPAIAAAPPSPYVSGGAAPVFDGYGQIVGQGKFGKYGKYGGGMNRSVYGGFDPMQQSMLLPPQSTSALQAQANAIFQMQQYLPGTNVSSAVQQYPFHFGQPNGFYPGQNAGQGQSYFPFSGQSGLTPYFDPSNVIFQQQQNAFAPYQQPNFYDPSTAAAFAAPYGYIPAGF